MSALGSVTCTNSASAAFSMRGVPLPLSHNHLLDKPELLDAAGNVTSNLGVQSAVARYVENAPNTEDLGTQLTDASFSSPMTPLGANSAKGHTV